MIRIVVTDHQQIDRAHAPVGQVRQDRKQRRIRAAAERWSRVVYEYVAPGLDDHSESLSDVEHRNPRCAFR